MQGSLLKWGRDATVPIARNELRIAESVSSACPMYDFFSSFYMSDVSDLINHRIRDLFRVEKTLKIKSSTPCLHGNCPTLSSELLFLAIRHTIYNWEKPLSRPCDKYILNIQ